MSERDPLLMDHEVDGIQELDNLLPRWWVWLFWLCCAYAFIYLLHFHVFQTGKLSHAKYDAEVAAAMAALPSATGPVEPSTDPVVLEQGKAIFVKNCVACHAADGGGILGPNLTDDYYIHGPAFADHHRTITEGVPAKGMITWRNSLKPSEILAVASYVWTLHGTKPAVAKAPEGVMAERPQ